MITLRSYPSQHSRTVVEMDFSSACGGGGGGESTCYFMDVVPSKLLVMGKKMRGEKREGRRMAWGHFPRKTIRIEPCVYLLRGIASW